MDVKGEGEMANKAAGKQTVNMIGKHTWWTHSETNFNYFIGERTDKLTVLANKMLT